MGSSASPSLPPPKKPGPASNGSGNPRERQIVTRLEASVLGLKSMIVTLDLIDWIENEENTLFEKKVAEGRIKTVSPLPSQPSSPSV